MATVTQPTAPDPPGPLRREPDLAWMVVELVVAIWAGIVARSVALTTFGIDSALELFTALVVLRQLLSIPSEPPTRSSTPRTPGLTSRRLGPLRPDRLHRRLVGLESGAAAAGRSLRRGMCSPWRRGTDRHAAAVALAAAGLPGASHSPALRADAACSLVCIYMSATLLAGLWLNALLGWWWADPLAALAMIWWIRGEARRLSRRPRRAPLRRLRRGRRKHLKHVSRVCTEPWRRSLCVRCGLRCRPRLDRTGIPSTHLRQGPSHWRVTCEAELVTQKVGCASQDLAGSASGAMAMWPVAMGYAGGQRPQQ